MFEMTTSKHLQLTVHGVLWKNILQTKTTIQI